MQSLSFTSMSNRRCIHHTTSLSNGCISTDETVLALVCTTYNNASILTGIPQRQLFSISIKRAQLCKQTFLDALIFKSPSFLQHDVQCVEEGVERGVEGQHEDGHGHADLSRDGSATGGQQTEQTDGEPAQEVGHGHGQESSGNGEVIGLSGRLIGRHGVDVN